MESNPVEAFPRLERRYLVELADVDEHSSFVFPHIHPHHIAEVYDTRLGAAESSVLQSFRFQLLLSLSLAGRVLQKAVDFFLAGQSVIIRV